MQSIRKNRQRIETEGDEYDDDDDDEDNAGVQLLSTNSFLEAVHTFYFISYCIDSSIEACY